VTATPWSEGDPIVVFGDDWDRHVSTMQHVFRHIMPDYPVVWVNAIGHRKPSLNLPDLRRAAGKVWAGARGGTSQPDPGPAGGGVPRVIIEPRVLPWHDVGPVHALNTQVLIRAVRRALGALGGARPPVLVTGSPPAVGVVGRLGEAASLYFCMDDFLHLPGVSVDMIAPLERRLLKVVDAVVATAASLTQSKRPASGVAHHLPQGVNYAHFATPQPEPDDLRHVPRPRIGFAGALSACVDQELVARVADTYRDCSVVLVGPIVREVVDGARLARPNIHLLGERSYRALPAYVQSFDVGIIPYVLNDWTRAVDPLKLLEYLAAGLPVVCSAIPEAGKYATAITIAADHDRFVGAIGSALTGDRARVRSHAQAVARQHTWQRRADELLRIIQQTVAQRRLAEPADSLAFRP
jgi:glycosyltransferase involved in cell wall biosynthesis